MTREELGDYFSREQENLHAFAEKRLRNSDRAWDVIQDTFVRVLPRCRELREADLRGYVWTALQRGIIDAVRKKGNPLLTLTDQEREHLTDPALLEPEPSVDVASGQQSIERSCRQILRKGVDQLSVAQQSALKVWLETKGDRPQALAVLRVSEPVITSPVYEGRLHQAKVKLRELWRESRALFAQLPDLRLWQLVNEIVCRHDEPKPHATEDLPDDVVRFLLDLQDEPRLRNSEGEVEVRLAGAWRPLAHLQLALLGQEQPLLERLFGERKPLKWLERPDEDDLPRLSTEQLELERGLQMSAQQAWEKMEQLTHHWLSHIGRQRPSSETAWQEDVRAVELALGGVAQAIRSAMPLDVRRAGEGTFRVRCTDGDMLGSWTEEGEPLNLPQLVESEARLLDHPIQNRATELAAFVCDQLRAGRDVLPGFTVTRSADNLIELQWRRASHAQESGRP